MKLESRWMACGLCSALALVLLPAAASAQTSGESCTDMQMLQHKCGQQQSKKSQTSQQTKQKTNYPNAKRKQPEIKPLDKKEADALNAGLAAVNSGDSATALKDLQPIADSSSNAYAKALATSGLAQVKYRAGDTNGAIALEKQAVDSNALDNDSYFQGLQALAQMYIADENYSDALTALDTWNKESGAQSADVYALQGNAYYRLQKYPQAVAAIQKAKSLTDKPQSSWDQIEMASYFAMDKYDDAAKLAEAALAKDPNNSALLQNVVAIYINAHQNQKALALLERARANGQIKDQTGYVNMAKLYDNIGQQSDDPKPNALKAVAVLKEGMSKGIVKPDYDSYMLMGQSYAIAGDYKQARTALQQAIAQGGDKPMGEAYLTLGTTELALNDKAAATAAYKHAEQDPDTRASAQRALKQMGHK